MVTQYIAYVFAVEDRNVKVYSETVPRSNNLVKPLQDGLTKLEVPAVNDPVMVLDLDSSHAVRFYTPVRKELAILTDDPANTQIESTGKVQIAAADLIELGTQALESGVKGDELKTQLTNILNEIAIHTHTCSAPASPSSPPLDAAVFATTFVNLLGQWISQKIKLE